MNARKLSIAVFLGLIPVFSGCQTVGYFDTKEDVTPAEDLHERLLKDVVLTIQNNYAPAKTRFHFPHGKEKLAESLEATLRKYGYGVSSGQKSRENSGIPLAYKFSEIQPGLYVLRVLIGENFQINRLYSMEKDGGYVAAGPLLMRRG